jgi:hypothetical protein
MFYAIMLFYIPLLSIANMNTLCTVVDHGMSSLE